ncbi:hypothetical protein [Paucisalibacillus globulus]|uniref:hypothetical protein n=1 Tax=Paucisalibacillus globulus TaxID=351095 RepID=UPI0004115E4F|nr:hypothetical protein [Paucisalibacillus globulus]
MIASITLWEAYLIESLRSRGMDNATLLNCIEKNDIKTLNDFDDAFDHTDLILNNNTDAIKLAINYNYKVKFITINGVKNLMGMKFDLVAGRDFQMDETKFYNVPLTNEQMKTLDTMISPLWKMVNVLPEDVKVKVDIIHSAEVVHS